MHAVEALARTRLSGALEVDGLEHHRIHRRRPGSSAMIQEITAAIAGGPLFSAGARREARSEKAWPRG